MNRILAGLMVCMVLLGTALASDQPPNFVVILTDDQGYGDVGCFGSSDIRTPRLDRMAEDGMKFTDFYAQPICGPSRAALMTGCYPLRVAEKGPVKNPHPILHSDEITVAELLKDQGYATGCFGKWDLAKHTQDAKQFHIDLFPTRQGFDYFFGTPSSNDNLVNLYRNEKLIEPDTDMSLLTKRYTDEAILFMEKNKHRPFFVYLPHTMPHTLLDASDQFKGRSKRGLYGDVIEEIDYNVGRILDAIAEMGVENNTYVLFTSDNGPWLIKNKDFADGHLPEDHGGSAGPLRSGKVSTFEGGQRVPTILWGPGRVPAGTVCKEIASTLDVLPTFAALAGTKAPDDRVIDGEDIRHLFLGDFEKARPEKAYYYYFRTHLQAVRQGKWKLHLARKGEILGMPASNRHIAPADRLDFKEPFLVDLERDLGETTNVAKKHPDVVKKLQILAEAMREDLGDHDRVGKNMRFFDLDGPRPKVPPSRATVRKKKRAKSKLDRDNPNVLFIAVDDLNDWTGCMDGHPGAKTPHIDRLAHRGVLFERAYCSAPICNPSRASLMTGILPSRSGIYSNVPFFRESPVLKDALTLPQYFRQNGYTAMRGGKIYHHLTHTDVRSWDEAFPSLEIHKPPESVRPGIDTTRFGAYKWESGPLDISDKEMDDGQIATWAVEQLARKHRKPFFLAVGLYHLHLPWFAPEKYFDMHPVEKTVLPEVKDDDRADIPEIALTYRTNNGYNRHLEIVKNGEWHEKIQAYQASISFTDAQVGRILDALDASPYADNTIVVLWSDHGWHLGEKQHWTKFTLWEESARVVLMIAGPKDIVARARCERTVSLIDLYPTLVELCGLPEKDGLDGSSLVPLLKNPQRRWTRPALTTHGPNNHSVRTERWRYTRWHTGDEELYDHSNDPMEWTNLARKEECADVKSELRKWLPEINAKDLKEIYRRKRRAASKRTRKQ